MALLAALQLESPVAFLAVCSVLVLSAYLVVHTLFLQRVPSNAPPAVSQTPVTGAIGFWTKRWDWYRDMRTRTPTGNFSFHAGKNHIVGLSGEKGRRVFFESRGLGLAEGYAVLFGATPTPQGVGPDDGMVEEHEQATNPTNRRLIVLLRKDRFRKRFPTLVADVKEGIEAIRSGLASVTDPFESIYRIVFRLTIRMVGPDEIAEDADLSEKTLRYFELFDKSATATTTMFPRLPSPSFLQRTYAGTRLYMMIEPIVKRRTQGGEKRDDALQYLLDLGDRTFRIIEFMLGALFAGLLNTGINAAYILCYLACAPEWLSKVHEEVRNVAAKYAKDPNAPLYHQLDDLPLEAFESEFPIIDLCLRDSIRINTLGTAFRKNISGKDVPIGNGEVIPPGSFATYATADVHLDPNLYPDPEKWDPSRYERAEDKKAVYGWIGWGVAKHPCLGTQMAKLELNLITAYFVAAFDFQLQDKNGNICREPPRTDYNGYSAQKPKIQQFLKVTPRGN